MKYNSVKQSLPFWISIIFVTFQNCAGAESCDIKGSWYILKGRLFDNYEGAVPYTANRVTFHEDTVELASGFFYNTLGWNDDYPNGRYPFVYYGNKEKYKIEEKELFIFSKPYDSWSSFEITCLASNQIQLTTANADTVLLERIEDNRSTVSCNIKTIRAQVHKGTLDQFNVGYKVTMTNNDVMIYEQQDTVTENFTTRTFKLRKTTFQSICEAFHYVDVETLKSIYPATESDYKTVEVELEFVDGRTTQVEIQDFVNAPHELQLALIPVLYLHQQFVYPPLAAKKFQDK